jgi:5'(3')-deoxyribonucleotidase
MKPTVLLDVDGILANFTLAAVSLVNEITGKKYKPSDITTWEVFDSIPVYEGAVEGVKKLKELADIICVTSPFNGSPTWAHERELWLERHFGADISYVIHTRHKERIHGDIFIDDKYEHVRSWFDYWLSQNNDYVIPVLWQTDRTINTEVVEGVTVATNWNQVVQLVHNQFY